MFGKSLADDGGFIPKGDLTKAPNIMDHAVEVRVALYTLWFAA